jgi:predicted nucleotidyltransferase
MIDLKPEHLRLVREILHRYLPDREVWVFGSRVTGTAKPHSDLDLVIRGSVKLSTKVLSSLNESFATSDLPMRVDVVDWNRISPEFRKIVEKQHERI